MGPGGLAVDWIAIGDWVARGTGVVWQLITSEMAQRLYVVSLSAGVLLASLRRAYNHKAILDEITETYFEVSFPGRVPTNPKSIHKRDIREAEIRHVRVVALWRRLAELVVLGVVVPSAFLGAATIWYDWFDPSQSPLVLQGSGEPVRAPPTQQLIMYIADQILRGGLFDFFEVFNFNIASLTNNTRAYAYSTGLVFFHLYVESFMLFGLLYLGRATVLIYRVFGWNGQRSTASSAVRS